MIQLRNTVTNGHSAKAAIMAKEIAHYRSLSALNLNESCLIDRNVQVLNSRTQMAKAQMEHLKSLRYLHSGESIEYAKAKHAKYFSIMREHETMEAICIPIFNPVDESFDEIYQGMDEEDDEEGDIIQSILYEAITHGCKSVAKKVSHLLKYDTRPLPATSKGLWL